MAFIYDKNQLQPLSAFAQSNPFGLNNVGNTNPYSFGSANQYQSLPSNFAFNPQTDLLNTAQGYANYASAPANAFGLGSIGNTQAYTGIPQFDANASYLGLGNVDAPSQGSGIGDWFGKQLENTSLADLTKAGAGLASSLYGIYASGQQTKMAKQQMSALNDQWQQQWNAQRKLANNQMSDAYEARVKGGGAASRANSESTEDYMKRKGV